MTDNRYRVPLDSLDRARVARADQVVLVGDGTGPPPEWSPALTEGGGGADGPGDGE